MSVEISGWGLTLLAIAAVSTYFVKPLLVSGRDWLLWWFIDKWLMTDKTYRVIEHFAFLSAYKDLLDRTVIGVNFENGVSSYLVDGEVVSIQEYRSAMKDQAINRVQFSRFARLYHAKRRCYRFLTKNYRQEDFANEFDRRYDESKTRAAANLDSKAMKDFRERSRNMWRAVNEEAKTAQLMEAQILPDGTVRQPPAKR